MKTQQILQSPIAQKMYKLKFESSTSILTGNFKNARIAQKEFAKLAVDNFDIALKTPAPVKANFSLFSTQGLKCLQFLLYKTFCKKTPEEKQLKRMLQDYRNSMILDIHQ